MTRVVRTALAAAVTLTSLSGCAYFEGRDAKKAAGKTCGDELTRTPAKQLPTDVPLPSGARVYDYAAQGKTQVFYAALAGTRDDLTSTRDRIDDALKSAGYRIKGTDQEKGIEAESEFAGAHDGTIRVRPLCAGQLEVRVKLES